MDATVLEWITAIGTLGAALVALGIAVAPPLVRRFKRPRLAIICGQEEPHVRPVMEGMTIRSVLLRAEVRNEGRSEARHVRGQIRRWWAKCGPEKWVEYDLDPLPTRWTSRPQVEEEGGDALIADLPSGVSDYLELSRYDVTRGKTYLRTPDRLERPFIVESNYPLGEHRIEVMVSAENTESKTEVIKYVVSHERFISEVTISEPPPHAQVTRVGLLQILGKESGQEEEG